MKFDIGGARTGVYKRDYGSSPAGMAMATPNMEEGESTLYVDDFEGSQTTIDVKSALSWSLSSVPERNSTSTYDFFGNSTGLDYGFRRAKLAWYTIDPIFYTSSPSGISKNDLSLNKTRRVFSGELYPNTDML